MIITFTCNGPMKVGTLSGLLSNTVFIHMLGVIFVFDCIILSSLKLHLFSGLFNSDYACQSLARILNFLDPDVAVRFINLNATVA